MKTWKLYPTLSAPMPFQLALDEVLFRSQLSEDVPLLRFYYSSEPWTTVGYSDRRTNTDQGNVCRRLTGGGKVDHGNDLIFAFVARKSHDSSFKSVRESYWKIHESVKKGFEALDKDLKFYRCDENLPTGNDCFKFPIATDLSYKGKKIAGGAQKRSAGSLLHEESLQLPKGIEDEVAKEAILQGFEKIFEVKWVNELMDPVLLSQAKELAKKKYGSEKSEQPIENRLKRMLEAKEVSETKS